MSAATSHQIGVPVGQPIASSVNDLAVFLVVAGIVGSIALLFFGVK